MRDTESRLVWNMARRMVTRHADYRTVDMARRSWRRKTVLYRWGRRYTVEITVMEICERS